METQFVKQSTRRDNENITVFPRHASDGLYTKTGRAPCGGIMIAYLRGWKVVDI